MLAVVLTNPAQHNWRRALVWIRKASRLLTKESAFLLFPTYKRCHPQAFPLHGLAKEPHGTLNFFAWATAMALFKNIMPSLLSYDHCWSKALINTYTKVCKIRTIYPASNLPRVMAETKESKESELHLFLHFLSLPGRGQDVIYGFFFYFTYFAILSVYLKGKCR